MKNYIKCVFCFLVCLILLSACSGQKDTGQPETAPNQSEASQKKGSDKDNTNEDHDVVLQYALYPGYLTFSSNDNKGSRELDQFIEKCIQNVKQAGYDGMTQNILVGKKYRIEFSEMYDLEGDASKRADLMIVIRREQDRKVLREGLIKKESPEYTFLLDKVKMILKENHVDESKYRTMIEKINRDVREAYREGQ